MRALLHRFSSLVVLVLVVGPTLAGGIGSGGARAASATAPTTGLLRICSGCASYGLASPSRYSYVILNSWQAGLIPQLKAANPGLKVLVYKDVAASLSYACNGGVDNVNLPAGLGYCWTDTNHPEWFLKDTTGARIEFCDFHGAWQMDVGDAGYQQRWLDNVLGDLRSAPWDGVMLDDTNQSETWHLCGRTIAKYPSATDYAAATESFLARVGPGLRAAGYLALPNIALDDWWTAAGKARWDRWVSYGSGAVQEYFTKWGRDSGRWFTDDGVHDDWSLRQALFARAQALGKTFVGVTYAPSSDLRSMRYARASFLLDWDGGASALVFEPTTPEAQDPYAEQWTTDLGTPTGARVKVGVAWKRTFTGGVVALNPSPSTTQTVSLDGPYVLPSGVTVTSVTVGPTDAVLLTTPTGAAPPASPPHQTSPPSNTGRPTIAVARSSRALTASAGSWSDATSFTYRWLRCDRRGNGCTAIPGVSSSRYAFGTIDVGKRLRVAVTATNGGGSATSTSAPTKRLSGPRRLAHRVPHRPARSMLRLR